MQKLLDSEGRSHQQWTNDFYEKMVIAQDDTGETPVVDLSYAEDDSSHDKGRRKGKGKGKRGRKGKGKDQGKGKGSGKGKSGRKGKGKGRWKDGSRSDSYGQ
eukprot:SAG11_NODE_16672_length_540_cov_55.718821_1_plen_101_part_10